MTKRPAARPARTDHTLTEPRVATYLRISTDEDHQPFSLDAQRQRLDAFVASQPGWTLVRSYTDQMSGAYAERPGLDQALRDARLGAYDVLLVYRVDRFARSLKVLVGLLEELEAAGVAFRSATEPIDTANPTGRMLVQLLGVFAEFERATIIDRVIAGMERKAARGHWPGGRLPYGLAIDTDKHLVANPDELPLIEGIFDRYTIGGAGADRIAAELNERGRRTRSGRPFSRQVVLSILRNRSYLGEVTFRGAVHQSSPAPFIDPMLFAKAEAILAERGENNDPRFKGRHPDYLLAGLMTCGRCHRRYVGSSGHGKRHRYRYYTCWTRNRYGAQACDSPTIRADATELAVLRALAEHYRKSDFFTEASQSQREQLADRQRLLADELASIEADIKKTEAAIERYMEAFERGALSADAFGERVQSLGHKAKALRARQNEIEDELPEEDDLPVPDPEIIAELYRELEAIAASAPDELRKHATQTFVAGLVVTVNDEQRPTVLPTYRAIIPPKRSGATEPADAPQGEGVRTTTSLVGARGLEPPTSAV